MAAKFIVALSCLALCHSSPLILNGQMYRNGRAYLMGQGYTGNGGGKATGSASIDGGVLQAYGTASTDDQNQLNRNIGLGEVYPGQAVAKAEIYDTPQYPLYGSTNPVIDVQNVPTYYAVPAPATVVSYEQNFNNPAEISYEVPIPGSIAAESSASVDRGSESSHTSVRSDGSGSAESFANTQGIGNYGVTSSNSKTFGSGFGSASSNVNNGYVSTASKTNGFGSASSQSKTGLGALSSETKTNGGSGSASSSANNVLDSVISTSNTQGSGFASSKADINNLQGIAITSAKRTYPNGISWKFGTQYQVPSHGAQIYANSQSMGGSSKSSAQTNGNGNIQTKADTQGYGSADAKANLNGGYMKSVANTNGLDNAKSTAENNGIGSINTAASSNGFGFANSEATSNGVLKSTSNTRGSPYGSSNAQADINHGTGSVTSSANSIGYGQASSTANTGPRFGAIRYGVPDTGLYYGGLKTITDAKTTGQGSATSSVRTQGLQAGYKVINSSANSSGYGTAQSNAQSF